MPQFVTALVDLCQRDVVGPFVIGLASIAVLHAAVGLGRSRQWYVLPVGFGLTALAGFLLNPLADSSTLLDLKSRLTSYETLTLLCIVQFALVGASALLGIWLQGKENTDRKAIGLAAVSAVPAPILVIAMLLIEQAALAGAAGARPEAVGREVGLTVGALFAFSAGLAMCLPGRLLTPCHVILSAGMVLACMFVPFLQDPLPQPMGAVDWESLKLLGCLAPILAAVVVVGVWWPWARSALCRRSLRERA